jgi:acetolactate synthase-1/3 small subunit
MMIEITGVESKIEGLIQVLNEGEERILEISRTGRMTMRRGHHTSRVMKAMGVGNDEIPEPSDILPDVAVDNTSFTNEPE